MKSRIGILTDSTAQFTTENYSGRQLVDILPFDFNDIDPGFTIKPEEKSTFAINTGKYVKICSPPEEIIHDKLYSLCSQYNEIIILVVSKNINPLYVALQETIKKYSYSANFYLVDSQTFSVGLGLLVQITASSAYRGFSIDEIKKNIRSIIPRIYSIFSAKNLSFLYNSGLMDPAQAFIGEFLSLTPCFLMENGRFIPTHKAKNFRHTTELFLEFISEFSNLRNIALVYGEGYDTQDFQIFRSRVNHQFSTASFSEIRINDAISTLLGPKTAGIFLLEKL